MHDGGLFSFAVAGGSFPSHWFVGLGRKGKYGQEGNFFLFDVSDPILVSR